MAGLRLPERRARGFPTLSLRSKILGMVAGLVSIVAVGAMLGIRTQLQTELAASLDARGIALSRDMAARSANLVLTENTFALHRLVRDTKENNPDVRYVFVLGPDDQVLVHSFERRVPPALLPVNLVTEKEARRVQVVATNEGLITDVATPVLAGRGGTVRVGLSQRRLAASVAQASRVFAAVMVAALLGAFALALVLTRNLTRPVAELGRVARAVGRGELTARASQYSNDEIGELAVAFNAMTDNLARSRGELLRRMHELEVLHATATAISGTPGLDDLLEASLRKILQVMPLRAGWVLLDGGARPPRLAAQVGLPSGFRLEDSPDEMAGCVCAQVRQERRPVVVDSPEGLCPRWNAQTRAGFTCCVCVPLVAGERLVGVLTVATDRTPAFLGDEIELLGSIGRQVGVAVENARLWDEVRRNEALRGQLLSQVIGAQEAERRRVARELHDEAGRLLTPLLLGLRMLDRDPALSDSGRRHLADLRKFAKDLFDGLHHLAVELRPDALDQMGLVGAVESCLRDVGERAGLAIDFEASGFTELRIPADVEIAVYRVAQEALANVVKHAAASRVGVVLERRPDAVVLVIEDNGCGFDADRVTEVGRLGERGCLGLFGMRERAALLNGRLTIESGRGRGTTVFVEIPLQEDYGSAAAGR